MGKRTIFLSGVLIFMLALLSYKATFALFSDSATSTNNLFAAASVFPTPTPNPEVCAGTIFASTVVGNTQGQRKDGSDVLAERSDPNQALGTSNWVEGTGSNFYTFGYGGVTILSFASPIFNNLTFYEATNGRATYPLESIKVEVSQTGNGSDWEEAGVANNTAGVMTVDFSGTSLSNISYVRLTDTSNPAIHTNDSDGYDLDAVSGSCTPID